MPLVDIAKKIEKSRDKLGIAPNEQILMACMSNPRGTVAAIAAGGMVGAAIRAKVDKNAVQAQGGGHAAAWPGGRNMLAITSERLVLCAMSTLSGKPTSISASWPHAAIAGIEVESAATRYPFTVVFVDGTMAQAEGAKGSGADQLPAVVAQIWG